MFLYSKKGQIITISTGLQKIELTYDQGQDNTTLNWRSNQKAQGDKVL